MHEHKPDFQITHHACKSLKMTGSAGQDHRAMLGFGAMVSAMRL
jgi:hypothetical protein